MNIDLNNDNIRETLVQYCKYLGEKYNDTHEGKYRIKYNSLYPLLFLNLSNEKKEELSKSFMTSLDIFPITKITSNQILLREI